MPKEKITLGSGKMYTEEFTTPIIDVKATITEMVKPENLLGYISGGATLEYKPDFTTVEDDLALVSKTILTKEEVTLKSGILTWCGNTLKKICTTAKVEEKDGLRIVRIGGIGNQDGKIYVILFVHEDAEDGNSYVLIVGNNQAGFSIAFTKDKETVIDAEFKAKALDDDGTKVIYAEDIPATVLGALTVTSVAGSTTGKTAITVLPTLTSGNNYRYKAAATVTLPALNDSTATGYTTWDGTSEIVATTGNEIMIVEVDSTGAVKKASKATVTAK